MALLGWIYRLLHSLRLAVVVLSGLTISLMVATVLESKYDTATAQFWVYRSLPFRGLLFLLGLLIFTVAVSRWPWKKRHIPFLLAHLGILTLLTGSWITDRSGLDGSLRLAEGESSPVVELSSPTLTISDAGSVRAIPVQWTPPNARFRALEVPEYSLRVEEFLAHADTEVTFQPAEPEIIAAEARGGRRLFPAAELRLEGGPMRIQQSFWLWPGDPGWSRVQAGPAKLIFGAAPPDDAPGPWLSIDARPDGSVVWRSRGQADRRGTLRPGLIEGAALDPGWRGGVKARLVKWFPKASPRSEYHPSALQYGDQAPPAAIRVVTGAGGPGSEVWLGLGDRAVLTYQGREISVGFQNRRVILPFALRLERFVIDFYDGTRDPKEYSSKVSIIEGGVHAANPAVAGELGPIVVSMNEPLAHRGITFYQASYEPGEPRPTVTILSVNQDPGRPLKYGGSILIVLGAILLFAAKYRHGRAARRARLSSAGEPSGSTDRKDTAMPSSSKGKSTSIGIAILLAFAAASTARASDDSGAPPERSGWEYRDAGLIPVQTAGRLKPLDTFAREAVLFVSGSRKIDGRHPTDTLLSWVAFPKAWERRPFLLLSREDARRQLGLDDKRSLFSPHEIVHSHLSQYAEGLTQPPPPGAKASPRDQDLRRLLDRLALFRTIVTGEAWPVIPAPPPAPWQALARRAQDPSAETETTGSNIIRERFADAILAYRDDDREKFDRAAVLAQAAVQGELVGWNEARSRELIAESFYNRTRPFVFAWALYLAGALLWIIGAGRLAGAATAAGFLAHAGGIALRCYVMGRPPVTNMYESVIWVGAGALFFATVLFAMRRLHVLMAVGTTVAALLLIVADSAPTILDPGLNPLVPVLRSNYWLTIHVLTITLGYAAFSLTLGLANVTLWHYLWTPPAIVTPPVIASLNQFTYRAMQFGVVLLAAGTILGGVWADYSWGRFWGWDPKEVWALIALLSYLIILHARYAGWVHQFGFAVWSVVAFLSVLMAWYGVNFVLGVGLHSYGFSTGGQLWVVLFCSAQLGWVGFVALRRKLRKAAPDATESTPAEPARA